VTHGPASRTVGKSSVDMLESPFEECPRAIERARFTFQFAELRPWLEAPDRGTRLCFVFLEVNYWVVFCCSRRFWEYF